MDNEKDIKKTRMFKTYSSMTVEELGKELEKQFEELDGDIKIFKDKESSSYKKLDAHNDIKDEEERIKTIKEVLEDKRINSSKSEYKSYDEYTNEELEEEIASLKEDIEDCQRILDEGVLDSQRRFEIEQEKKEDSIMILKCEGILYNRRKKTK